MLAAIILSDHELRQLEGATTELTAMLLEAMLPPNLNLENTELDWRHTGARIWLRVREKAA